MKPRQTLSLEVSHEKFLRVAFTILSALATAAVAFLGRISTDINALKTSMAVVMQKVDDTVGRVETLETAVFDAPKKR